MPPSPSSARSSREASRSAIRESLLRSRRSVEDGLVSEAEYLDHLARRLEAARLDARPEGYMEPVTEAIPAEYMEEFLLVPFGRSSDGRIRVALACEPDATTLSELEQSLGGAVHLVVVPEAVVRELIDDLYRDEGIERLDGEAAGTSVAEDLESLANQPPVIRLVNFLVHEASRSGASDVHLEAMEEELNVRYRIDGVLHEVTHPPKKYQRAIVSRIKILGELDVTERRRPQDGRLRMRIDGRAVDLRVSTVPTLHGESVVLRLLDQDAIRISLEELGFAPAAMNRFRRLVEAPHGIVLATGPTGSGKTTTLYAALARRNRTEVKIVTIEDPVEYQLDGVNQTTIRPELGLTFARGLRSLLRQDPDILMVGEMRDLETAEIAIQAALTGHLVFSTLHTNDSPGGVTRLLEMGIEEYLVSSTVSAILAQRLVRTVCMDCARTVPARELPIADRELLESVGGTTGSRYREGTGCARCNGTGYRGRTGIFELMIIDDAIREAILERAPTERIRARAAAAGMRSMRDDGLLKAREGITTVREVLRVTGEEVGFG